MQMIAKNEIKQQSMNAWNAWRKLWVANCRETASMDKIAASSLVGVGRGKTLIQCAFGHSLAGMLDTIRRQRIKFDVMCCDKAFGYLMENGIVPDWCVIADASVNTDWIKNQDTSRTTLIANVAANTGWTKGWEGRRVFYVNWDNIGTAKVLGRIAGIYEVIPASSNVSNAQIVFASQVLGYNAQLLVGFDYSWADHGTYYAGQDSEKRYYMHHMDVVSPWGYIAKTSTNLNFSCRWIMQYLMKFYRVNAINCSGQGLLDLPRKMPLARAIAREC